MAQSRHCQVGPFELETYTYKCIHVPGCSRSILDLDALEGAPSAHRPGPCVMSGIALLLAWNRGKLTLVNLS